MNVLGIIPARGGSVGIPRKNLAVVAGKTLLEWAVLSARGTRLSRLVVSTDDQAIGAEATRLGVEVLWRPSELAQGERVPGSSSTFRACRYHVEQMDVKPDAVMVLQPTCPLREPADVDAAIERMEATRCEMVVSFAPLKGAYVERVASINPRNNAAYSPVKCDRFAPRQDLVPLYVRSGDVYLIKTNWLLAGRECDEEDTDTRAIVIPAHRYLNIDTPNDLAEADRRLRANQCEHPEVPIMLRTMANDFESGEVKDVHYAAEFEHPRIPTIDGDWDLPLTGQRTLEVRYRKVPA